MIFESSNTNYFYLLALIMFKTRNIQFLFKHAKHNKKIEYLVKDDYSIIKDYWFSKTIIYLMANYFFHCTERAMAKRKSL